MKRIVVSWAGAAVMVLALAGCNGLPAYNVPVSAIEVPSALQQVLNAPADFVAPKDDTLQTVAPGTVVDPLAQLDGCWGGLLTWSRVNLGLSLYTVIHFDRQAGTYQRWSADGLRKGGLWPAMPLIVEDSGTFRVQSDNTILLQMTHNRANVDPNSAHITATLNDQPLYADHSPVDQPALATLQGDRLLLFLGAGSAAEVNPVDERQILMRFDCPAGQ